MNKHFIFLIILLILVSIFIKIDKIYLNPEKDLDNAYDLNPENAQNNINQNNNDLNVFSKEDMNTILKSDPEILNMLLNGGQIIIGPSEVTDSDISNLPAIYSSLKTDNLYKAVISYEDIEKLIIFNKEKVIKKVNMMSLSIN